MSRELKGVIATDEDRLKGVIATDEDRLKAARRGVTSPKESMAITTALIHLRGADVITCDCERCIAAKEIISGGRT